MFRSKMFWRLAPLIAALSVLLSGCGDPTLSTLMPKGPVARDQYNLMMLSLWIMLFVLVVVFGIYFYVIIRFRQRKGQTGIPKQVEGNHMLEILWTVIPIILLVILSVPTVMNTFKHATDYTKDKNAIHVKVTAHQFWWQFEYPDYSINTAQDLVIPVGKNVSFEVTSADVNHAFWIPSLAGKIDANPGMINIMYAKADEPNVYKGKCAELCGASHAYMDFKVKAIPEADFTAWVDKMKNPTATPASAAQGEQLFKDNCMACHAVNPAGPGLGPNLNGFASRERIAGILERGPDNDANLAKWIHDPQSVKPGAKMPQVMENGQPLSSDKIDAIIKYLDTLK